MKYIFGVFFLLFSTYSFGQVKIMEDQNPEFNVGVVYDREFVVEASWHSNGFNFGFMKSKIRTYYKTTFYHFDLGVLNLWGPHTINVYNMYDMASGHYRRASPGFAQIVVKIFYHIL